MPTKSSPADKLIRLALLAAAALLVVLMVLTVVNFVVRLPEGDQPPKNPGSTSSQSGDLPPGQPSDTPINDGVTLPQTADAGQAYQDSQRVAVWILCVVAPIGVYFCYLGIAVARNPERYSKKVRRLFYKDGYLH